MCEKEIDEETEGYPELCVSCVADWRNDAEAYRKIRSLGHTRHCACRIVWGDGECECKNEEGGIKDAT
jgi:murein endopeptidase